MRSRMMTERAEMEDIIRRCEVCNVGMVDHENMPYVLPFNFAFDGEFLYLHSDPKGKKIDILKENPNVCISFSTDHELYHRDDHVACSYSMKYRSVLVYGKVSFIEEEDEKIKVLNKVMKHYTGKDDFKYSAPAVRNVRVYKVSIREMHGKVFGHRDKQ